MTALMQGEHSGVRVDLHRLEAQVALSWQQECELLAAEGLHDGMTIVDLGCGPGLVAASLLDRFPAARVVAVDADASMCALATSVLAPHRSRSRVVQAAAHATGLADASAGFVLARYLFQHLHDPASAAAEALRILRPGGTFAVIDVDAQLLGIVTPVPPLVQGIFERGRRHQASTGGHPLIGRELWKIVRAAGFEEPRLRAFVYHSDELGKAAFEPLLSADQLQAARAAGELSEPEMAIASAAVRHFLRDPGGFVLMLGFMAIGRKGVTP
jgi:SAM-dependent methyltransferase